MNSRKLELNNERTTNIAFRNQNMPKDENKLQYDLFDNALTFPYE